MKLGILTTDIVKSDLAEKFGQYPDMFSNLLHEVESGIDISDFNVIHNQFPDRIDDLDAYLITGSSFSVYEDLDWIKKLSDFVKKLHINCKPLIGICFGHQLIAHSLGGRTEKAKSWNIGIESMTLNDKGRNLLKFNDEIDLLYSHQDQVMIPANGATTLASTPSCSIAMFSIGSHILAMQAHPEYKTDFVKGLITSRKSLFDQKMFTAGLESLSMKNEGNIAAKWIVEFLKQSLITET